MIALSWSTLLNGGLLIAAAWYGWIETTGYGARPQLTPLGIQQVGPWQVRLEAELSPRPGGEQAFSIRVSCADCESEPVAGDVRLPGCSLGVVSFIGTGPVRRARLPIGPSCLSADRAAVSLTEWDGRVHHGEWPLTPNPHHPADGSSARPVSTINPGA